MKVLLIGVLAVSTISAFAETKVRIDISSLTQKSSCSKLDSLRESTAKLDVELIWEKCILSKSIFPLYAPIVEYSLNPDFDESSSADYAILEKKENAHDNGIMGLSERYRTGYAYTLISLDKKIITQSKPHGVTTRGGRTLIGDYYQMDGNPPKEKHLKKTKELTDLIQIAVKNFKGEA